MSPFDGSVMNTDRVFSVSFCEQRLDEENFFSDLDTFRVLPFDDETTTINRSLSSEAVSPKRADLKCLDALRVRPNSESEIGFMSFDALLVWSIEDSRIISDGAELIYVNSLLGLRTD